jgi:hypothetical protein
MHALADVFREKRALLNSPPDSWTAWREKMRDCVQQEIAMLSQAAPGNEAMMRMLCLLQDQRAALDTLQDDPAPSGIMSVLRPAKHQEALLRRMKALIPSENMIADHPPEANRAGIMVRSSWAAVRDKEERLYSLALPDQKCEPGEMRVQKTGMKVCDACEMLPEEKSELHALTAAFAFGSTAQGKPAVTSITFFGTEKDIAALAGSMREEPAQLMAFALGEVPMTRLQPLLDFISKTRFVERRRAW